MNKYLAFILKLPGYILIIPFFIVACIFGCIILSVVFGLMLILAYFQWVCRCPPDAWHEVCDMSRQVRDDIFRFINRRNEY